jgi:hypothetical protein
MKHAQPITLDRNQPADGHPRPRACASSSCERPRVALGARGRTTTRTRGPSTCNRAVRGPTRKAARRTCRKPKAGRPPETAAIKSAGNAVPIATRDHRCRATPGAVKMASHQVNGMTTRP